MDLAANDEIAANDPCSRREKGGWHQSVGHCAEMTPAQEITGVWVTAFEESSFFPGASARPESNDELRYLLELELDLRDIRRLTGRTPDPAVPEAYLLTFVGRRTRDPGHVDCYGGASFSFVVDRMLSARFLGYVSNPDRERMKALYETREPTVSVRHAGRWGELERRAVAECRPRNGRREASSN
jgi:hypothetical protein